MRSRARKAGMDGDNWRQSAGIKGGEDGKVVGTKSAARETLEEKWVVENRVAIAKAKVAEEKALKDLEFQKARDVPNEVKKSRAKIMRDTEQSKVAVEKAFSTLKATGNVPGFCETVVSDGSGHDTISPDSSASMHEFRQAQKTILDLEAEVALLRRREKVALVKAGESVDFTVNDGTLDQRTKEELLGENIGDAFGLEFDDYRNGYESSSEECTKLKVKRVYLGDGCEDIY